MKMLQRLTSSKQRKNSQSGYKSNVKEGTAVNKSTPKSTIEDETKNIQAVNHNCDDKPMKPKQQISITVNKKAKPFPLDGHAGCVLYILQDTWKHKLLCDVSIKVEKQTFDAHRLVLSSCAGYFYDKFCTQKSNFTMQKPCQTPIITVPNISPDVMEIVLESMYTGKLQVNETNIVDILLAARQMRYYTAEHACDEYMQSIVNKMNCYSSLEFAFAQGFPGLAEACLKCIAENFEDTAKGPGYLGLKLDQVVALLSRNDLNVRSELVVFDRMLDWINCDIPNRLGYGGELLREVRLPLMPATDIVDHVENTSYLMEVTECRHLVKEALHYHCLPARQSVLQNSRTRHRSTRQVDVVFAIGGAPRLLKDPVSDEITAYNPKSDQWEFVTKLPKPIHHNAVAVLGGFIYVVGGESENNQKSPISRAYRFDPRTGQWLRIADMIRARESFQLCVLTNMLYAIGGRIDPDLCLADVERYNPAVDAWEDVAPLSSPRRAMAAASLNGRIYIGGGTGDPMKFERYNALSDSWELRQPLPESRFFAQLAAVNKCLYLLGGATVDMRGVTSGVTSIQCYCPVSDTWTALVTKLESRAEGGCAVLNNKIYMVGGFNWDIRTRLKSAEVFDVENDTVENIGDITVPLTGIACCAATICDLSLKSRKESESYIDNNTCNFYHHCSQSSCNLAAKNSREDSQTDNKTETESQSVPPDTERTKAKRGAKAKKKVTCFQNQNKMPRIIQKSTGSKYSQRYRLTRAMSCEPPKCGNYPDAKVKLPRLKIETKATRE